VYLRQPEETATRQTFSVSVDPLFRKDDVESETQRQKIDFEMHLRLEVTESWVNAPEYFMLMHNGRSFKVEVDPTGLPAGVHTAKVLAYEAEKFDAGAVFALPITVVKTLKEASTIDLGQLEVSRSGHKLFLFDSCSFLVLTIDRASFICSFVPQKSNDSF
jgi:tripeptidyl-peptidase-2